MLKDSRLLAIASGLSLMAFASIGLWLLPSVGFPTIYCPLPTLTLLSALILSEWRLETAAVLVPVVLFFAWAPGLLVREPSKLPKRTVWAIAALAALTVVDFSIEWKYGMRFHGLQYTITVAIINVVWVGLLWWVSVRAWRQPSFKTIILTHWLMFAWLSWYAFPFLGEPI
jgi:hypothetical protein